MAEKNLSNDNLSYPGFLIEHDPELFKEILLQDKLLPSLDKINLSKFKKEYHTIIHHDRMDSRLKNLFKLYLAAKFITARKPPLKAAQHFFQKEIDFKQCFGFDPGSFQDNRWCMVPVLFTGNARAYIRFFVLGLLDTCPPQGILPPWGETMLDSKTITAISTAAVAAEKFAGNPDRKFFFCFPLAMPGKTIQFKGTSLALPLALGFIQILKQEITQKKLIATGSMDLHGNLLEIGHLKTKIEQSRKEYHGVIYPRQNILIHPLDSQVMLPVSNLRQAWMFFSLYSENNSDRLPLLSGIFENPLFFVKNICHLPSAWIEWMHKNHSFGQIISRITADPELFYILLRNLKNLVQTFDLNHAGVIAGLISDSRIDKLAQATPLTALKWSALNLALANHKGDVRRSSRWEQKGCELVSTVRKIDIAPVAEFFNHAFVARHNQYIFEPVLPENLAPVLKYLETQYRLKCSFGCRTDLLLGQIYGTIMQNYAFCGPQHINRVEKFSQLARQALGQDHVLEFKKDWIRQYSYLTFARLDANDMTGAEKNLIQYFEKDSLKDILSGTSKLSPWHYAVLARFFSQTPSHPAIRDFYHLLHTRFQTCHQKNHPWQLIAYNLGLIAHGLGKTGQAVSLLEKSIAICFSAQQTPTICIMALLPASMLISHGYKNNPAPWEKKIQTAAKYLDKNHFYFLTENSFENALKAVRNNPGSIFPFSYR